MSTPKAHVLYVYHGTAGVAGAYVHGLALALEGESNVDCEFAVNSYYEFPQRVPSVRITPLFFSLTENTDRNPFLPFLSRAAFRLPLRYAELAIGYARALRRVVSENVEIVNLSVIDDELPTLAFAWAVKRLGRRLHVTAHDVLFHGARSSELRRRRTFALADRVVAHYPHVQRELESRMSVPAARIVIHPFPWADVRLALDEARLARQRSRLSSALGGYERVFVLAGVLRKEKGLETLLEAWRIAAFGADERCALVIAGKPTEGVDVAALVRGMSDVILFDHYLTSEELWAALERADVVVLPYGVEWYAHSSMALLACQAGKPLVTSDITLFRDLASATQAFTHRRGDPDSLAAALRAAAATPREELRKLGALGAEFSARMARTAGEIIAQSVRDMVR